MTFKDIVFDSLITKWKQCIDACVTPRMLLKKVYKPIIWLPMVNVNREWIRGNRMKGPSFGQDEGAIIWPCSVIDGVSNTNPELHRAHSTTVHNREKKHSKLAITSPQAWEWVSEWVMQANRQASGPVLTYDIYSHKSVAQQKKRTRWKITGTLLCLNSWLFWTTVHRAHSRVRVFW